MRCWLQTWGFLKGSTCHCISSKAEAVLERWLHNLFDRRWNWCASLIPSQLKAHWWALSILKPPSSSISKIFSETAWPIKAKFNSCSGMGEQKYVTESGSHDQDGRHAHIWQNPFKTLLQSQKANDLETWYVASGTLAHHTLFKWWPWLTVT